MNVKPLQHFKVIIRKRVALNLYIFCTFKVLVLCLHFVSEIVFDSSVFNFVSMCNSGVEC